MLDYIQQGIDDGATLLTGGTAFTPENAPNGYFVAPTIFTHCTDEMRICKEEIFDPVMFVLTFKDEAEVRLLGQIIPQWAWTLGVTQDISRAHRVSVTGESFSDDYNYPELYSKLGYDSSLGHSEAKLTYTWDYFGLGGEHYTMLLGHTVSVAEGHDIRFSVDRSTSLDEDKWSWDGSKSFNHFRIAYLTSWSGFDFSLAAEDTSMNLDTSDERLVLSVSRQFML